MANVYFNNAGKRFADGTTDFADSGGSGKLRALLLTSVTASGNDLDKDLVTVADAKAASGYAEYNGAGYPAMASRPLIPTLTSVANNTNDRADVSPPSGASGVVSFGNPAAATNPVRYFTVYEHLSDTDDTLNILHSAFDEGTIVGVNGSASLLPMNFSWGGRAYEVVQG